MRSRKQLMAFPQIPRSQISLRVLFRDTANHQPAATGIGIRLWTCCPYVFQGTTALKRASVFGVQAQNVGSTELDPTSIQNALAAGKLRTSNFISLLRCSLRDVGNYMFRI
uniref:Uncharacterized protein n=1 Tax=Physcomitrium patens TaxID=3218 RepID=A0A2K1LAF1_PHYPA|nr:hypothetical protein PHYPA_001435 [Physcomitrium patens]